MLALWKLSFSFQGIQMALQESAAKTTPERANCSKRLQFSNGGSAWPRAGYNAPGDKVRAPRQSISTCGTKAPAAPS